MLLINIHNNTYSLTSAFTQPNIEACAAMLWLDVTRDKKSVLKGNKQGDEVPIHLNLKTINLKTINIKSLLHW